MFRRLYAPPISCTRGLFGCTRALRLRSVLLAVISGASGGRALRAVFRLLSAPPIGCTRGPSGRAPPFLLLSAVSPWTRATGQSTGLELRRPRAKIVGQKRSCVGLGKRRGGHFPRSDTKQRPGTGARRHRGSSAAQCAVFDPRSPIDTLWGYNQGGIGLDRRPSASVSHRFPGGASRGREIRQVSPGLHRHLALSEVRVWVSVLFPVS